MIHRDWLAIAIDIALVTLGVALGMLLNELLRGVA